MNEILLSTTPRNAPMGRVCNDSGVCFLGEVDDLISYSDLSTHFGVTQGTLNSTSQANKWLRFQLDNVELVISKVVIRNSITWDHLYSKGLVYGTNDNGRSPTGTLTNQLRTINIMDQTYKVRLLKGADPGNDPFSTDSIGHDLIGTRTSEWSRLFYPIITNDPNVTSYMGSMLANYTEADLQMRWISATVTPGAYNWCQERHPSSAIRRVVRGGVGPSYFRRDTSSFVDASCGWRACLELVT